MNTDAVAAFVAVLAACLAASWCAAGVVAWVQAVGARREARAAAARPVLPVNVRVLPVQRTESSAAFRSIDGHGNARTVGGRQS